METVEVFKTNVETGEQAEQLITLIIQNFPQYAVNFDLDDCDRVLRIKSETGFISCNEVIDLLKAFQYTAEVLPDIVMPVDIGP